MKQYKELLQKVIAEGEEIEGRNGGTLQIIGETFKWDMRTGFPCLTLRELEWRHAITELRFFLLGKTDKTWLQERGNHFWDKFASGNTYTEEKKNYLGPIYGKQWVDWPVKEGYFKNGYDQLNMAINELKKNPTSRRLLVSAWNVGQLDEMCLPPCHDSFQFLSNGKDLDLIWRQRSCDICVGLPWDILLYAFLLEVVAKEVEMEPRHLIGQFGSLHLYKQHLEKAKELLTREPKEAPLLSVPYLEKDYLKHFAESDMWSSKINLSHYQFNKKLFFEVIP